MLREILIHMCIVLDELVEQVFNLKKKQYFFYFILTFNKKNCLLGQQGTAHTLITDVDKEFAGYLVKNLESVNQTVPKELFQLALKSSWFQAEGRTSELAPPRQRLGLGYKQKDRSGFGGNFLIY